jgi:hypothetical protein
MSESDTPETGPLTIDQALDRYEAAQEATPSEAEPEPTEAVETAPEAEEPEVEETEVEAEPETEEPESEEPSEEAQVLTLEEYGEVRVQLGDESLTLAALADQLEKGTLRQADYTRKTTEVAQLRKELDAEKEAFAEKQRQLDAAILEASGTEEEPDWAAIFEEDPIDGPIRKERWLREKAQKEQTQAEARERLAAQAREVQQKQLRQTLEVMPDWADQKAYQEHEPARQAAAIKLGFAPEEYSAVTDPRMMVLLEYARLGMEKGQKAKAIEKKIAKAPKVLKPGAAKTKADRVAEEKTAARRKLSRPHSINDRLEAMGF